MSGFGGLREVAPGILGWSATHPGIGTEVYSHYVTGTRTAIDPIGAEGLADALAEAGGVELIVLTNRHHYRGAGELSERFGCPVVAPEVGLHEFEGSDREVGGYAWGEELAPGVVAHEVGAICPDDGAIHIAPTGDAPGALALADAVIAWDGELSFVPDKLMDEPEKTKTGIRDSCSRLAALDFDVLLLAHGPPIPSGGRQALTSFVERPKSADF
jgi:hypothetical protein